VSRPGPTAQTGAYVTFDTTKHRRLEARIGISFVSVASARRNLEAEAGGRDFASVRVRARRAWDRALGKIQVAGGSAADRRTFYTMPYPALVAPSTFSDVYRRHRGIDSRVTTAV